MFYSITFDANEETETMYYGRPEEMDYTRMLVVLQNNEQYLQYAEETISPRLAISIINTLFDILPQARWVLQIMVLKDGNRQFAYVVTANKEGWQTFSKLGMYNYHLYDSTDRQNNYSMTEFNDNHLYNDFKKKVPEAFNRNEQFNHDLQEWFHFFRPYNPKRK